MLNAKTLANTAWEIEGIKVRLLPGGKLKGSHPSVPFEVSGTWSVSGATLTVSAMGQTETAQIVGQEIVAGGKPARRLR